jgi:hypothetical protein
MKLRGLVPSSYNDVSVSDLCIPTIGLFCCSKLWEYKLFTYT